MRHGCWFTVPARPGGLEPPTRCLEGSRSIQTELRALAHRARGVYRAGAGPGGVRTVPQAVLRSVGHRGTMVVGPQLRRSAECIGERRECMGSEDRAEMTGRPAPCRAGARGRRRALDHRRGRHRPRLRGLRGRHRGERASRAGPGRGLPPGPRRPGRDAAGPRRHRHHHAGSAGTGSACPCCSSPRRTTRRTRSRG